MRKMSESITVAAENIDVGKNALPGRTGSKRPRIAVVVPSERVVDALLNSGALTVLAERVEIKLIAGPEVPPELAPNATVLDLPSLRGWRQRLDTHMWYHALFRHFRRHRLRTNASFKAMQLRPIGRALHHLLAHPLLAAVVSASDAKIFFRDDAAALNCLKTLRPDLIIVPGSALDSYSHMVLRSAQRLGIRSAMIISHWDYFSKKGLLRVAPDRIYVWGDDMASLAVGRNGVDRNAVCVVGAPQFEKYRQLRLEMQDEYRCALGYPRDGVLVLFAGTAVPYDELSVLRELSEIAAQPRFAGCRIVYRPHPRAWERRSVESVDPKSLANVLLDVATAVDATSDAHYLALIGAVNGVASPFSTMILEGAIAGKPAFCISFSDNVNDWNFAEANNTEHIQAIMGRSWLTVCTQRRQLREQFENYLIALHNGDTTDKVRREAGRTIHFDDRSYAQRLLEQIEADFSLGTLMGKVSTQ
ncbi:MAG: hypothetical protein HY308_12290 [Gammaproteobacteria bacterium]|nr:hypothetical protein [Gammaproteobacteria bacterium]